MPRRRFVYAVAPIAVLLAACSSNGSNPHATGSTTPPATPSAICTPPPANASAKPPANVPAPSGTVFYLTQRSGATTQYFGYVAGSNVRLVRDLIKSKLITASYTIGGTDQEANVEADAEFRGPHTGSVQVRHLVTPGCAGLVRVRYQLER